MTAETPAPDGIRLSTLARLGLVLSLAFTAAGATWAQKPPRVDDGSLRHAAASGDEWLTYGHDYAETHYSPLTQIDTSNVQRLGLAWTWDTESPTESSSPTGAALQATPLVSGGVMYGSLAWSVLFAVEARTGRVRWRWDPEIARPKVLGMCCGPKNRGVALYNGKVFAGLLDGRVVALNQETGKLVWSAQVLDPGTDMILTSAVRVVKGKVIVGSSGAEHGVRGQFSAWDAETGKLAWRFYTVPGDPAKGFEHAELEMAAKTWNGEWWKMGGGGTVWDAMAYDAEADLLYVGTGNGSPWNINYRSPGGGDNLFLASILAVRPDTGKLVWHFQTVPGDTWDYTATQPLMLADLTIKGAKRKVIMQAPKNGFFYVLDRITGEFISGEKFVRRMTWATGLDAKGRPIEAPGARFTTSPIKISPGAGGAHNWEPMSFHPGLGLVYIPGQESVTYFVPDPNYRYNPGYWNTGVMVGRRSPGADGEPPLPAPPINQAMKEPDGSESQPEASGAFLVAWDPVAQKARWRVDNPGGRILYGGTLATAGNLVFHGASAYHAATGEKLWSAPVGNLPATPMTYMLDGKQYVTILARYPGGRVFTFVLDGKTPMPPGEPAK